MKIVVRSLNSMLVRHLYNKTKAMCGSPHPTSWSSIPPIQSTSEKRIARTMQRPVRFSNGTYFETSRMCDECYKHIKEKSEIKSMGSRRA